MNNPYQSPAAIAHPRQKRSLIATCGMICMYFALFGIWLMIKDIDHPAARERNLAFVAGEFFVSVIFFCASVVLLIIAAVRR